MRIEDGDQRDRFSPYIFKQYEPEEPDEDDEIIDDGTTGEDSNPTIPLNPTLPTNNTFPPPPDTMTTVEKYGMGITVAITVLFVVVPIEAALLVLTFGAAGACGSGAVLGCLADIPLAAADIAVADFGISLTVQAAESISSGRKREFEWIIIPRLIDIFRNEKKGVIDE